MKTHREIPQEWRRVETGLEVAEAAEAEAEAEAAVPGGRWGSETAENVVSYGFLYGLYDLESMV